MSNGLQASPFDPAWLPVCNMFAQAMREANEPLVEALNGRFEAAEASVERRHAENLGKQDAFRAEVDERFDAASERHREDVNALWKALRKTDAVLAESVLHQKRLLGPDGMGTSGLLHDLKTSVDRVENKVDLVWTQQQQGAARGEGRTEVFKTVMGVVTAVTGIGGVVTLVYAAIHFIGKH